MDCAYSKTWNVLFSDSVLTFIRSHPLMDEAVAHEDNKPIFYKRDIILTHLVVDPLHYDVFGKRYHYTVYYAGTSKFRLRFEGEKDAYWGL